MAAGSGLTAAAALAGFKSSIALASGAWSGTGFNWLRFSTTQGTLATRAAFTEWTVASNGAYAGIPMGAAGVGWTLSAWNNATGVTGNNTNLLQSAAVTLNNQSLFSVVIADTVGPTGGNYGWFADVATTALAVNIGQYVTFNPLTDVNFALL